MQVQDRITEAIKQLDVESMLKLYDIALALQDNKQSKIKVTVQRNLMTHP